jgi:alpha-N-arabinofuranosidase
VKAGKVTGRILTADKLDAHNTFDAPDAVKPADFADAKIENDKLTVTLPAHSVVMLTLE